MGTTQPSALEGQLEDLKRLLEGSVYCSGSLRPAPDDRKMDRCAELTETIMMLQQENQDLTTVKSGIEGQRQNAAMTGTYYELRSAQELHAHRRPHCIESSEASTNMYSNVEQKNLIKILRESHEDRIRQITAFQQGNVMLGNLDVD